MTCVPPLRFDLLYFAGGVLAKRNDWLAVVPTLKVHACCNRHATAM